MSCENIENIFKKRIKDFIEKNFNNLEYINKFYNKIDYWIPFILDDERDLELYDQDVISLLKENIHQLLIRILENSCFCCHNIFDDF